MKRRRISSCKYIHTKKEWLPIWFAGEMIRKSVHPHGKCDKSKPHLEQINNKICEMRKEQKLPSEKGK